MTGGATTPRNENGSGRKSLPDSHQEGTPPLGFEPRSQAPQACSLSKLTYEGSRVASRRRYNCYGFSSDTGCGRLSRHDLKRRHIETMDPPVDDAEPPDGHHLPLIRVEPAEQFDSDLAFPFHLESAMAAEVLAVGP